MTPNSIELLATVLFGLSILHTFFVGPIHHLSERFRQGSIPNFCLKALGEVEVVFGFWAVIFLLIFAIHSDFALAADYLKTLHFTEAVFVFVIMAAAATKPILYLAERVIALPSLLHPVHESALYYFSALTLGPILGSFITEPAAMTVTAYLLKSRFFDKHETSARFKYTTLAVLFVNVSIGGTLTHFAAPPVVMIASKWGWTLEYMLTHFGYKAAIAVALNSILATIFLWREIPKRVKTAVLKSETTPSWLVLIHTAVLAFLVFTANSILFLILGFLGFLGIVALTKRHQSELKVKAAFLVGFFLAGLIVFGGMQRWWLEPLLTSLGEASLFVGAALLTAITDNAALTYLGSQVPTLSEPMKYALVAGAVTGGGLTVIANAPNPAGYSILKSSFGRKGISAKKLFLYALPPTFIAAVMFWFL